MIQLRLPKRIFFYLAIPDTFSKLYRHYPEIAVALMKCYEPNKFKTIYQITNSLVPKSKDIKRHLTKII